MSSRVAFALVVLLVGCANGDTSFGDSDGSTPVTADARASSDASGPDDDPDSGTALAWERVGVNVPIGPLCNIPIDYVELGGDPANVDCELEADRFSDRDPADVPASLRIVTWNIQYGAHSVDVLDVLRTRPELAQADVLLLQEVPRFDLSSDPQLINQGRDLAESLAMDYVFGVEWDRRLNGDEQGEHGVAILSKYPIGNVRLIRHVPVIDWYAEDNRYGGRMTLRADLLVGGRLVRVYSSHLDTRPTLPDDSGRAQQGAEVRDDADDPAAPSLQIVGGDLNTWTCNPLIADCTTAPAAEQVIEEFLSDGWTDGTEGFNGHTQLGAGFFLQRLDWFFFRGGTATFGTAISDAGASDHFPVYFDIDS